MRILALRFEPVRATPAVAEFLVRVELDGPAAGCDVRGVVVGPRCPGASTVEVAYPLTAAGSGDTTVSLRGVIPEPNLWAADAPFGYAVSVELRVNGEPADTRGETLTLRRPG